MHINQDSQRILIFDHIKDRYPFHMLNMLDDIKINTNYCNHLTQWDCHHHILLIQVQLHLHRLEYIKTWISTTQEHRILNKYLFSNLYNIKHINNYIHNNHRKALSYHHHNLHIKELHNYHHNMFHIYFKHSISNQINNQNIFQIHIKHKLLHIKICIQNIRHMVYHYHHHIPPSQLLMNLHILPNRKSCPISNRVCCIHNKILINILCMLISIYINNWNIHQNLSHYHRHIIHFLIFLNLHK